MKHDASPENCLFCAIAAGNMPAHMVFEDERIVAFLDIRPIRPGHIQIVPRAHFPYFDEMPEDLAAHTTITGQHLARRLKEIYGVRRVAFLYTGGDIPHAHAHLVPMVDPTDITSRRYISEETLTFRDLPRVPDRELTAIAAAIRDGTG